MTDGITVTDVHVVGVEAAATTEEWIHVVVDEAEAAHSAETDPDPSRTNEAFRHHITKNPCPEIACQEPDPIPDTGTCDKNIDTQKK